MALSPLVEYILAQEKSGGEPLATLSGVAIYTRTFPANATTSFILKPADGEYAFIVYRALWDMANIPAAFLIHVQHRGIRTFDGTVQEVVGFFGVDSFTIVTAADQLFSQVTNRTNVQQLLSFGFLWLTIRTKEDYELVQKAIQAYQNMNNDAIVEQQKETNRLLCLGLKKG